MLERLTLMDWDLLPLQLIQLLNIYPQDVLQTPEQQCEKQMKCKIHGNVDKFSK